MTKPTKKQTAEALAASIKHWEENRDAVRPQDVSTDGSDCALCSLCVRDGWNVDCTSCPVAKKTNYFECRGSPYWAAQRVLGRWMVNPKSTLDRDKFRKAAQAEIDFLKSLEVKP